MHFFINTNHSNRILQTLTSLLENFGKLQVQISEVQQIQAENFDEVQTQAAMQETLRILSSKFNTYEPTDRRIFNNQ